MVIDPLISRGDERAVGTLIVFLFKYGDKDLAEDFLNCGNIQLSDAASEWAKIHGYRVSELPGIGGPSWGGSPK